MTHLTDELLNEYLDHELPDRALVKEHLALCADCAARLAALQSLFAELESLPEAMLSKSLAARFTRTSNLSAVLPRSLRLTVILQAAAAVVAFAFAAPFVTEFVAPVLATLQFPSFTEVLIQIQTQWITWLNALSQIQLPSMPELPVLGISSLSASLMLFATFVLWFFGNRMFIKTK